MTEILPVDVNNDFVLDLNMYEKYIPFLLKTNIKKELDNTFKKYENNKNFEDINFHYFQNMGFYQPKNIYETIPLQLRLSKDIYEINFIPIQYLLNLVEKYNYNPKKINVLIWGCGCCVIDYYLDKIGYNITSYDNWSQIDKVIVTDFLSTLGDNNIFIPDNLELFENKNFDVLIDTGNFMNNKKIIQNPNVKIIFTWAVERLDWESNTNDNLEYLQNYFIRLNLPTSTIFINKKNI